MSGEKEEKEIDKLRKTIEEFRAKAERCGIGLEEELNRNPTMLLESQTYNDSVILNSPPSYPPPALPSSRHFDAMPSNNAISKRISSGSISSMSSHASHSSMSSASSGGSNESDLKNNKKKRWLPLKSFTRPVKNPQAIGQVELSEKEESALLSPTITAKSYVDNSLGLTLDARSYNEIQRILQEKDRKLTDSKLEALTLQHQLHQLQDQIVQMQHEMQLLRIENERLQTGSLVQNCRGSSEQQLCVESLTPSIEFHREMSGAAISSRPINLELEKLACFELRRMVSPGSDDEGLQMKFTIASPSSVSILDQQLFPEKITIGSIPVSRKATWEKLDKKTNEIFLEYCQCIDGDQKLGLTSSSIAFYKVGEQTRVPGTKPPELLPCAFIIGNVNSVDISLKDASCGYVDLISFKSLISKEILSHYLKILQRKKRIILYGPSGTGKTVLAHSFANYVLGRERLGNKENTIFVYDVKKRGEEELKTQIASFAVWCNDINKKASIPQVIVVENCYLITSFHETFSPLIEQIQADNSPFIIGTMLQSKKDILTDKKCFELISCATNSSHVKNYLARYLRRRLIESAIEGSITSDDEFQNILRVITWLPFCWHQVNRCLETNNAADVTIGPRVFTSCPIDFYSSCSWFVQMWNYVIVPYITVAIRNVRQSQPPGSKTTSIWVDPTDWVVESFPWNPSDMGCDNSLRLKRICDDDLDARTISGKNPATSSNLTSASPASISCNSSTLLSAADLCRKDKVDILTESPRQFSSDGDKDVSLRSMKLMEFQNETNQEKIWRRFNAQ